MQFINKENRTFQKSTIRPLVKVASAVAVLVLLAGCGGTPVGTPVDGPQPTADASIDQALLPFYEQKVTWKTCGHKEKTYCAFLEVPVDWNKPDGERLKLAVAYRKTAVDAPLGSILTNPGGPGVSGVNFVGGGQVATAELSKNFNLVSFDPRGVGRTEPEVQCLGDKEKDEQLYGASSAEPGTAAFFAEKRAQSKKFVDACVKNTGSNLQFVDTVSVARDMDVVRAVFGDSKINYLGYSYGTYLGSIYAALFPKRVGRMVLDGAMDPTTSDDHIVNQAKGFDKALKNFLKDCLAKGDCTFTGDVSAAESQIFDLLRSIEKKPMKTDSGRELTTRGAIAGITKSLYSEHSWPKLRDSFKKALKGDGTLLLESADSYNHRNKDGTYDSNLIDLYYSITCADYQSPINEASLVAEGKRMLEASKIFGRYLDYDSSVCEQWPFPAVKPLTSYAAAGSDKILVIGTTGDPATPYHQAVSLATKVLNNAQLITYNGDGHTVYANSNNACIDNVVDNYFIKGIVPTKDPQCKKSK